MKKTLILATLTLTASSLAFASGFKGPQNSGGFQGPSQGVSTVKEVRDSGMFSDDNPVTLVGHIKGSLGGEKYTFADETGEIVVEIDHDKWSGQNVTPETKVQLSGEIDKDLTDTRVDVDMVKLLP
ncbi:NirD/YgiW/YdeI family stress tolerance protein [Vibrio caribbeanicus]|uniref:NirD/YgiW/YdeI family stress tolerance protein n=1 Tax=Vibrio caribbeanicus TaxID=701175 RepID=UPI00228441EC|nr:NirD/YgiW/YdeI family stress tolerance protein [Vibrio caribbeanicus]MCY9844865.1 NirD/YgiW/YdeI family stress tolerance protein [Vibrio caribbeanicus]